jgi:hypothetical protein
MSLFLMAVQDDYAAAIFRVPPWHLAIQNRAVTSENKSACGPNPVRRRFA